MYNLIENIYICSKVSGSLWKYHRHEKTFKNDIPVAPTTSNSGSFKFKNTFIGTINDGDVPKDVKIATSLNCLSNFYRTIAFSLITCGINVKAT